MDLAFRYPAVVQVISRNGHDVFYGCAPDFGIESYEVIDPGNLSQEYMFHLKLRRMIGEALAVHRAEEKEFPPIRSASSLIYNVSPTSEDIGSYKSPEAVSTSVAAQTLGVHPNTIRSLFDAGVLAGALSKGGQRMILVKSLHEEEARMTHRAELRKLEARAKKKNSKRKRRRIQIQKEEKLERFRETMEELGSSG